jgi:glycosyltransferase involved in cell wall biosynthesis
MATGPRRIRETIKKGGDRHQAMRKKICIFCSLSSLNTGMPISTYKLVAGLAESGRFDVCAVLLEEGEFGNRLRDIGVNVEIIPFRRLRSAPIYLIGFIISYLRAGFKFFRFIRDNDIGIVHFSDIIDAPFYPVARFAGAKVVAHARVCAVGPLAASVFRIWASVFCSRVIAVSKFTKRYFGFGGRRASVVYNPGPDKTLFDPDKFAGVDDRLRIITISTFRRDKGHHNFLEIASRIKERIGDNAKFVIIGGKVAGHEGYYDEIMAGAGRMGLGGCLTVTGNIPHEQVPHVIADAAALLHVPDWEEALGGVILEAMAMGVTPVAYDCGGIGECFTDGVSGFLVRKGDFDAAADKAVSLLESHELRRKMSLAARAELGSKFSLSSYINSIEQIYEDVNTKRRSR